MNQTVESTVFLTPSMQARCDPFGSYYIQLSIPHPRALSLKKNYKKNMNKEDAINATPCAMSIVGRKPQSLSLHIHTLHRTERRKRRRVYILHEYNPQSVGRPPPFEMKKKLVNGKKIEKKRIRYTHTHRSWYHHNNLIDQSITHSLPIEDEQKSRPLPKRNREGHSTTAFIW